MNLSDIPARVAIPFANSAGSAFIRPIPVASQIGVNDGAASFTDGFPPLTFTPPSAGGEYVDGEDMNGILNHVTRYTRWQAAGGPAVFNAAFATAIGGYPNRAELASVTVAGRIWQSVVDGNLTDPDGSNPAGWVTVGPSAATLAQAQAGTDAATFLSPAVLSGLFGSVDGQSVRLPGGLIIKLGNRLMGGGASAVSAALAFTTPFPSSFGGIIGNLNNVASTRFQAATVMFPNFTVNGGTIVVDNTNSSFDITAGRSVNWLAWGR